MLLNREGKVFVGLRIDNRDEAWQMPQGGIDEGEEPWSTALRELEEETGIRAAPGRAHRPMPRAVEISLARRAGRRGLEGAVDRPGPGLVSGALPRARTATSTSPPSDPEFRDWKWIDPAALPDAIVPFKRELYRRLLREFADYL